MDHVLQFKCVAMIELVEPGVVKGHDTIACSYYNPDFGKGSIFAIADTGQFLYPISGLSYTTGGIVGDLFRDYWRSLGVKINEETTAPYYNSLLHARYKLLKGKLPEGSKIKLASERAGPDIGDGENMP